MLKRQTRRRWHSFPKGGQRVAGVVRRQAQARPRTLVSRKLYLDFQKIVSAGQHRPALFHVKQQYPLFQKTVSNSLRATRYTEVPAKPLARSPCPTNDVSTRKLSAYMWIEKSCHLLDGKSHIFRVPKEILSQFLSQPIHQKINFWF